MTRWTGTSGLILAASPPSLVIASRIAARSTTHGTPVKSCISTRAGRYWISRSGCAGPAASRSIAWMSLDRDGRAVLEPQQIFEQDLHRKGQARDVAQLRPRPWRAEIIVRSGRPPIKRVAGAERVLADGGHARVSFPISARRGGGEDRTGAPEISSECEIRRGLSKGGGVGEGRFAPACARDTPSVWPAFHAC